MDNPVIQPSPQFITPDPQPADYAVEKPQPKKSLVRELLETLGLTVIILGAFFALASPNVVHGSSMEPNFHEGQYVLTSRINHYQNSYQRGDVVILHSPIEDDLLIKRIIGLPNEQIKVSGGHVIIYNSQHKAGWTLPEPYLASGVMTEGGEYLADDTLYTIPAHEYIVMGDNREHSGDSRSWGPVQSNQIIGRVVFRYWPLPVAGPITIPKY